MLSFRGLLLLSVASSALAEPINPFARPIQDESPVVAQARTTDRLALRGVIVAGDESIANLNGTLLAIGEEESGYRLVSVSEDGATFTYQGESVTLPLDKDSADE